MPVDSQPSIEADIRPCLPAVEKLDGRVMLSVSADATSPPPVPPPAPIPYPNVIIQDSVKLAGNEFVALGTINGGQVDHKHKDEVNDLGNQFLKLDQVFFKFWDDLVSQKVTPGEGAGVVDQVNDIFLKIDPEAADLNQFANGLLLPAVQKVHGAAVGEAGDGSVFIGGLLGDLNSFQMSGMAAQFSKTDSMEFVKIGGEFSEIDNDLIDQKVDVLMGAPPDDQSKLTLAMVNNEFVQIKLENALISSLNQLSTDFVIGVQTSIDGLISNTIGGTGGGDTLT